MTTTTEAAKLVERLRNSAKSIFGPPADYGVIRAELSEAADLIDRLTAPIAGMDQRSAIVSSLIRDAQQANTDEAADHAAARIMAYLLVEPKGCPTPGACSAALASAR